jgi:hypothetical protein
VLQDAGASEQPSLTLFVKDWLVDVNSINRECIYLLYKDIGIQMHVHQTVFGVTVTSRVFDRLISPQ